MKKLIYACLFATVLFLQNNAVAKDASDIGQCMGACASEQGICLSYCRADGQCMGRCGATFGRCISRCN